MNKNTFQKIAIYMLLSFSFVLTATAAPIFNAPTMRLQPNGDTLHCLLSGDEFYHRLHDAAGYTIVQNPRTGYWVYADTVHTGENRWNVVATNYVAGKANPVAVGIAPNIGIDNHDWQQRQHRFDIPKQYAHNAAKTSGRNHGTLNNIVIFVRFSDDSEISTSFSTIDAMFNDSTSGATSMYNYFKTVSYNKIHIPTHYYPAPSGNNVISYQDTLPRNYYMPYDATTNPTGYQGDNERASREFGLLERAVNYINTYSPVSTSINLDMDNDGYVDNICFVVKGTYTGWNDLLWPHKWALYDRYVYINGKRVYTFNLQLEGSGSHYFSSSTFCHEMFHTLGAPDLYRYNVNTNVTGVGSWDLMCSNTTPPQTMGAYMKWKYGNWIDSVPEITVPGTYTLHSLGDADHSNIVYKIAAQEPFQWYVLEYRDNTEQFETTLPGKGLIIYRIDERFNGNANYDGISTFDEVYLFRPGADNDTTNGYPAQAFFSANANRTQFSPTSNPRPWLSGNVIDTTISITAIGTPGETITFTYNDLRGCYKPNNLSVDSIGSTAAKVSWYGRSANYAIQYRIEGTTATNTITSSARSCTISGLSVDIHYQWRVKGICDANDESDYSTWSTFQTSSCGELVTTTIGTSGTIDYTMPISARDKYSYTQMIYTASEIGDAMTIEQLAYNYADLQPLETKNNCVIYMALTDKESFNSTTLAALVPFSQLHKVYEGPLYCSEGWNTIILDSAFLYDGISNLVIAIDDNSNNSYPSGGNFYCSQTPNRYSSVIYTPLGMEDINPSASTITCHKVRKQFHPDIRLTGCRANDIVVIQATSDEGGTVAGGGSYQIGNQCTLTATADAHWHFVNWTDDGGQTITDNPYTFTVDSSRTLTAHFAKDQHTITIVTEGDCGNAWFQIWDNSCVLLDTPLWEGTFDYGTQITLFAEDTVDCQDATTATFTQWNDGSTYNPRTITLYNNCTYTAIYTKNTEGLETADDIAIEVKNSAVVITGAEGRRIELIDITGRIIARATGSVVNSLRLPAKGIYILRIEGLAARKIVN